MYNTHRSSSRIRPLTSLRAWRRDCSRWRRRRRNSPKNKKRTYKHHFFRIIYYMRSRSLLLIIVYHLFCIPCSLSRSDLLASTSGRSALSTWFRHCVWRELRVTVKLTKVTLEQRSGGNSTWGEDEKTFIITDRSAVNMRHRVELKILFRFL